MPREPRDEPPVPLTKPTTLRAAFPGADGAAAALAQPPRTRRWRLWLLAALGLSLALATTVALALRHGLIVIITQPDIQAQAERTFPITRDCDGVVEITYCDPVIILRDGHAAMQVAFAGGVMRKDLLRGSITVTAVPRYLPETGELYLDHATVDNLQFEHGPNRWLERYRTGLSGALASWLAEHPVYTLAATSLKKAAARAVVRSLAVVGSTIRIDIGW